MRRQYAALLDALEQLKRGVVVDFGEALPNRMTLDDMAALEVELWALMAGFCNFTRPAG